MKNFIAISTETHFNKLVYIATSAGESLANENGIDFASAIDFLFSLIHKRENRKQKTVFVSYGFSRDNEFIFSTMTKELKDKLFQSFNVKRELNRLEYEQENLDEIFFNTPQNSQEYEQADFERYCNYLSKQELIEVKINDYYIKLANGKRLTIRKKGKSITIYDIYGFFKNDSLQAAVEKWLGYKVALLDKEQLKYFPSESETELLKTHCQIEVTEIKKLATKLNSELEKHGINLARYHGATAVTSWLLGKFPKAKKYFHSYRYKRQLSSELQKATYQSYYGGRAEQFKLGTIENVNIFDINSAYAFASSFLPVLLTKPKLVREYENQPFSIWYCEYNFKNINPYFGYLPNRNKSNAMQFSLAGKGYFWFPEVQFILQNFPECIEIKRGYVWDYETAPFTENILEMYQLRQDLQKQNNPLEKVIKKALQSVYGKFFQHQGKGHFYNPFYAGFICSFVRRMLLDATKGAESETICFLTDAIHTTANLQVPVSDSLGEYKKESYDKVIYLDNGVYQCYRNGEVIKTKHKGSKTFDFENALTDLQQKKYYKADNKIFVGHNVYSLHQFAGAEYLHTLSLDKEIMPLENCPRIFEQKKIDFRKGFIDSLIIPYYGGNESKIYQHNDYQETDYSLDTIEARRI